MLQNKISTSCIPTDQLEQILLKKLHSSSFLQSPPEDIKNSSSRIHQNLVQMQSKGCGFMADIFFGKFGAHSLVIKCEKAAGKDALNKILPVRAAFNNEIYIYKTLLLNGKLGQLFQNHPKYYTHFEYRNVKVVVLEDLTSRGYHSWPSKIVPLSNEHVKLVMRQLAHLHAASIQWCAEDPSDFWQYANNLDNVFEKLHSGEHTVYEKTTNFIKEILLENGKEGEDCWMKSQDLYRNFIGNIKDIADETSLTVITHGDCWINNFLFKCDKANQPLDVYLLDWQLAKVASPIIDLSFFLYSACCGRQLEENLEEFLHVYHETLQTLLLKTSSVSNGNYSFDDLWKEWRRFSKYGVVLMPLLLMLLMSTPQESVDPRELLNSGTTLEDKTLENLKEHRQEYKRRVYGLIQYYVTH